MNTASLFFHDATAPTRPRSPHCLGFTIIFRHTTLGRTPDECLTRRRDIYLTTQQQ